MRKYTEEQHDFIKRNAKNSNYEDLKNDFNRCFDTDKTRNQIKGYCFRHKIDIGIKNEGTRFKKGRVNLNTGNPLGTESIDKHGQIVVKVRNDGKTYRKNWKLKKVVVWEQHYGEKPKEMMVLCLDGNEMNLNISNLLVIETGENLWLHKTGYIDAEPEVIISALYYLRLKRQRVKREKELKNK